MKVTGGRERTREDFAALLAESLTASDVIEGAVVKGTVVAIEKDVAVIDVGAKTEGRVPLKEFVGPGRGVGLLGSVGLLPADAEAARRWGRAGSGVGGRDAVVPLAEVGLHGCPHRHVVLLTGGASGPRVPTAVAWHHPARGERQVNEGG